jgi:nucleoside-diphosphate-sugar epimerase
MKILVTGAAGFIGSHVLPVLAARNGDSGGLVAVSRRSEPSLAVPARSVAADVSRSDWTAALPDEPFDAVIHLAQSRHYRDFPLSALDIFNVNVKSTFELADWATRHRVKRFVFASTGNVYGFNAPVHDEDDRCEPETMYASSKLGAEMLLKPFASLMNVLVLRIIGAYGPGQVDAMLPGIVRRFRAGDEILLAQGVGVEFNPIYVDDCSNAISQLLDTAVEPGYHVVNVGGLETVNLQQFVTILERLEHRQARVRVTADSPKRLVGSVEKIKAMIRFEPRMCFADGVARTLMATVAS